MLDCPECGESLHLTVSDDREDPTYTHLYEICINCGYTKSFVDYAKDK